MSVSLSPDDLHAWHANYTLSVASVAISFTPEGVEVRGYGGDCLPSQAYLFARGAGPRDAGALLNRFIQFAEEPTWGPSGNAPHVFRSLES